MYNVPIHICMYNVPIHICMYNVPIHIRRYHVPIHIRSIMYLFIKVVSDPLLIPTMYPMSQAIVHH